MALPHAPCELLLLEIHHPDDIRHRLDLGRGGTPQVEGPLADPNLGKQMPAHPVHLRQRQEAAKRHPEHPPEPLLKRFRVHRLHHLVLANHALRRNDLPQIGQRESVARDIRKNHAIAPWANQLALIA